MKPSRVLGMLACLVSLCVSLCAHQATAQMQHPTTEVWDFQNGLKIRGIPHEAPYLEGGGASGAGQICVSPAAGECTWTVVPSGCILTFDVTANTFACATGAGLSIGPASVLQASNGVGGFAAYGGSNSCAASSGQAMTGLTATGAAVCQDIATPIASTHVVTTQSESSLSAEANLGALPSGVLTQTVSGGVATLQTIPQPAGSLVGTTAVQRLSNKGVDDRPCPSANDDAAIDTDLNACDIVTVANLLQPSTMKNPTGSAVVGQWVKFEICSATSQALTWENQWTGEAGLALPSATRGGGQCDFYLFQYVASTSHLTLLADVNLSTRNCQGLATPGVYTNASVTVDSRGCVSVVSSGVGGGGSGTVAGLYDGDVQFKTGSTLDADSGVLAYDAASDTLAVPNINNSVGGTVYTFIDPNGYTGYLFGPGVMTQDRAWDLPDENGKLCVQGGTCFTGYTTASSSDTLTNKTYDAEAAGNNLTTVSKLVIPVAGCNAGSAVLAWDTASSGAPTAGGCTGSNVIKATADFADSVVSAMYYTLPLPSDWSGAVDARFKWLTAATSGNVQWFLATICTADAETDDPAFNTASSVIDTAKGTTLQTNDASITGVTMTGCAAGELLHLKVSRDATGGNASDTLASTASLLSFELTVRRTQ